MLQIKNRFDGAVILEIEVLKGADLQGADLGCADLGCADLVGASLVGADLRGADLRGADLRGANLQGAAVVIAGLEWGVYVTNGHVRIGCQSHPLAAWENFTDDEISEMAEGALEFWNVNKPWIIAACKSITRGE